MQLANRPCKLRLYGHRVHKDWRCVLHYNGAENWSVVYLQIGKHTQGYYLPE
jgi:hypothetical protein